MQNRLPPGENEPNPSPPAAVPFVLLPVPQIEGAMPLSLQQQLYQLALQQAQEGTEKKRPARYESDWLNTDN